MQDNYPQYRVVKIYDHREGDQFLTLYETTDDNATPIWVSSWEFYSYDEQGELYITEAFQKYCKKHGIPMRPPSPAELAEILRVAYN